MNKDILTNIISNLKKKGAKEIRSGSGNSKKPNALTFNGTRKTFTPDVVALYEDKRDIFSIENKIVKANISDLIAKWILFGLEARKHNGSFYLVVSKENSAKCQDIIDSKKLSAELITY
ncbi:hypothetical protein K6119_16835 [Paracrocinitomix mangrovi]|uniref:hypothetical protein n=1 Tax=Paracrocinitomix mangrovi TaxID=2862509 RepID=UPI001C8EFF77|nr:hypothetical protein [Paracrocinitomix mangrovi]UKN01394.1 hypothetical protein K6119_16835 [Paracrocinitomix mangrovi]